jgi:hypothetical protein
VKKSVVLAVAVLAILATGCRSEDVALRDDDRIRIQRPTEMQRVELPVTIRWTADGVRERPTLTGPGPFFAVFVDRAPVPAGTGIDTLVDDDCEGRPDCPDLAWFAERDIYVTGEKEVTIERVPDAAGQRTGADGSHHATVVLIDGAGVRQGEIVDTVEFEVVDE